MYYFFSEVYKNCKGNEKIYQKTEKYVSNIFSNGYFCEHIIQYCLKIKHNARSETF